MSYLEFRPHVYHRLRLTSTGKKFRYYVNIHVSLPQNYTLTETPIVVIGKKQKSLIYFQLVSVPTTTPLHNGRIEREVKIDRDLLYFKPRDSREDDDLMERKFMIHIGIPERIRIDEVLPQFNGSVEAATAFLPSLVTEEGQVDVDAVDTYMEFLVQQGYDDSEELRSKVLSGSVTIQMDPGPQSTNDYDDADGWPIG